MPRFGAGALTSEGPGRLAPSVEVGVPLGRLRGAHPGCRGNRRTARRLFDSGAIFGVGIPEALVIAVLGWFLLGPEELYRLAKQFGNWLGELRVFVGQAAKQYESALDDDATRKTIEGIRNTQRTVSELSSSWRSVADSLRDPLNLSSTFESTYSKYSKLPPAKANPEEITSGPAEPLKEETAEELDRKRSASKEASKDLWYPGTEVGGAGARAAASAAAPPPRSRAEALARLEQSLGKVDGMARDLQELRKGLLEDRAAIQALLEVEEAKDSKVAAPAPAPAEAKGSHGAQSQEPALAGAGYPAPQAAK